MQLKNNGLNQDSKGGIIMDLKNNIEEQREYLKNNLENINIVTSAVLGTKINLQIDTFS